jgi:hypothetical protein
VLLPPVRRTIWPTVAFALVIVGVFVAAYFLLRRR